MVNILLDCDPGHDDAVAILAAARLANLVAVTTVSGNVPLDLTATNALITTQLAELDIPVYAGADRPLVVAPRHAADIHGASGLGGPELPPLTRKLAGSDGVRAIIDACEAVDDLWLVATGPLTNVALALRQAPRIATRVKGISLMGGGAGFGNRTPAAEFNIWFDPDAAHIVFASGAPLYMCGLNLTHQLLVTETELERFRALESRVGTFVADMLAFYSQKYSERFFGRAEGPLHDPCAVLAVTHPELFEFAARHVAIERTGEHTRGMTVVDERGVKGGEPPNVQVAYRIDAPRAFGLLIDALEAYP